jgi:hypothetical protein
MTSDAQLRQNVVLSVSSSVGDGQIAWLKYKIFCERLRVEHPMTEVHTAATSLATLGIAMSDQLPSFEDECFFITPMGAADSQERARADGLLEPTFPPTGGLNDQFPFTSHIALKEQIEGLTG